MKGFYIYEVESRIGTVVDCLELGDIDNIFTHEIAHGTITEEVKMQALVSKGTKTKCSPNDTYDFETGALIALMKMCGVEKVKNAAKETFFDVAENSVNEYEEKIDSMEKEIKRLRGVTEDFYKFNCRLVDEKEELMTDRNKSWKIYQRKIQKKQDRINELEAQIKASEDDKQKNIEYYEKEIERLNNVSIASLKEKIEKLKLDCEKLQHGYNDMIFCGGRQNGKQYTALVELFKKIDQKKVDAAYKEAYNTTLPVWQKEVLRQAYEIRKESKEKPELPRTLDINGTVYRKSIQIKDFGEQITKLTVDSLIEENRAFTRKCVDEWLYKVPTKREEMWGKIFALHKKNDVIIEVKKEDVNTFLHEIEDKFPEITWLSGVKIFETKYTIKDIYEELKTHDRIYFRLHIDNKLSYSSDSHLYLYRDLEHISYLPPMRWDLFKKGRLAVKVDYDNYKEFYEACEKFVGKKPSCMFTGDFTVSICKKDGYFEIFTVEDQKKTGRNIVDWEDVRENTFTMEDPYDTWVW